jgi:1,6-anhydro-N-acetylmuramate kinase
MSGTSLDGIDVALLATMANAISSSARPARFALRRG